MQATTLNTAGLLAWHQTDYPAVQAFYAAGLALRCKVGDKSGIAASLNVTFVQPAGKSCLGDQK